MKHPHVITSIKEDHAAQVIVPRLSLPGLDRAWHDERQHGNRAAVVRAIEGRLITDFRRCHVCIANDATIDGRCLHCAGKEGGR